MDKLNKTLACLLDIIEYFKTNKENTAIEKIKKLQLMNDLEAILSMPNETFNEEKADLIALQFVERYKAMQ